MDTIVNLLLFSHTVMLVKLLYYDVQDDDPLMYVVEFSEKDTIQSLVCSNINEIKDINQFSIYQKIETFVSPELRPEFTIKQIIPADIIELLIQPRISDDEMLDMINGIQNENSSLSEMADSNILSGIQLSNMDTGTMETIMKSTNLQNTQSFNMRTSQMHKMTAKSSRFSSVNINYHQLLREQQKDLSNEYSWANDFQSSPLYFDKAESTNLEAVKQYIEQHNIQDVIVVSAIVVTQMHDYDVHRLLEYCGSFISGRKITDEHSINNAECIISIIRNQYGGWCILFFSINKKEINLISVLPICCRFSINFPSKDAIIELWECNYDQASQNIQNNLINLDNLSDKNVNQKYLFMLRLDGLNITFKTTLQNTVLLQQTLNIAIREISGVFQKYSAGTLIFEQIIRNRMQSLKFCIDVMLQCQLSSQKSISWIEQWIEQNLDQCIKIQNSKCIYTDLVNYIFKYANVSIQLAQKALTKITQHLEQAISQKNDELAMQSLNIIEQFIMYPSHPDQTQTIVDTQQLQQLYKSSQGESINQKVKDRIKLISMQLSIVKEEQMTRQSILPQLKNPPIELTNQQIDIEKIEDPTKIQYNSVYLSVVQIGPNNQIKTNSKKDILVSNICPTSDLIFFNPNAQYLMNLLTFLPQLVKSKIKIMNLNNTLATLVRKLRKLLETEDVDVQYSLLYPVIFNRKDFNKLYNQSTVVFYVFQKVKKDGDLQLEQYQKQMTKIYGNAINAPQLFLQNVNYTFLDNINKIDFGDQTKFYYFLITTRYNQYQQYGIEFLIDVSTDFLYYETHDNEKDGQLLFQNIEYINRQKMIIQQIENDGYRNMFLVLAPLKDEQNEIKFMNFMQISLKFLLYTQHTSTFNQLLMMYIQSLDALNLYKQSVEEPDDMPKLPKNDLDSEKFNKYMNKYFHFYKKRVDVQQYKKQTLFNNKLLFDSPLTQLMLDNYQFNDEQIADDELYLFQDFKLQNFIGADTITPDINPEFVPVLFCEQYEEDTTFINKRFSDTLLNNQINNQQQFFNQIPLQTQQVNQQIQENDFVVQFNDIKSLMLEILDKIELQEQQRFISKQNERKQQLTTQIHLLQQELSDQLSKIKHEQQQLMEQPLNLQNNDDYISEIQHDIEEQTTYQELICQSADNFIKVNKFISNLIDGIDVVKQVKYAVYSQKQIESQTKIQVEIANRRQITKNHLTYLNHIQQRGIQQLQNIKLENYFQQPNILYDTSYNQ